MRRRIPKEIISAWLQQDTDKGVVSALQYNKQCVSQYSFLLYWSDETLYNQYFREPLTQRIKCFIITIMIRGGQLEALDSVYQHLICLC